MEPDAPRAPHVLDAAMFWSTHPTGGVRRVLSAKRQHLLAAGWQHSLLVPEGEGLGLIPCGGISLPRSGGYRFVVDRARAVSLITQARPDLIEAADPYVLGWASLEASQRLGVPAVAFCHSHLPALLERWASQLGGRWAGQWARERAQRYLVRLYGGFDLVLAPSRSLEHQLRHYGLDQVQYQPLGVDCGIFRPAARKGGWARWLKQALGLPPATRLLLYCGRFAPEKRLPLLARAVRALGPGHVLLCVGAGPCTPRGSQLRVLPPVSDPASLARMMASCDAFVHAGDQETFGLAALEAMACRTPVVLSSRAGLGELGADVALAVDSACPADWADAMRQALNEHEAPRLDRALARARTLDWSRVTDMMMRRYATLLNPAEAAQRCVPQERPSGQSASVAAYSFKRL
ncbi:glycosyltransferase [Roseateles sp. DB2]|uniref:glycosyltransferase n=1 Tax=Roseateles sp. DB2 TaxID=3453717 RepID=UPI003EEB861C